MDQYTFFLIAVGFIFIMSIVGHELGHAYSALQLGDDTAYQLGRITWNPMYHIHPVHSIAFPIVFFMVFGFPFGGADPVPVNHNRLTRFKSRDLCDFIVTICGPLFNLATAIVLAVSLHFIDPGTLNHQVFRFSVLIQLVLFGFNLLPIPPLDGGHILRVCLTGRAREWYEEKVMPYGIVILVGFIVLGGQLLSMYIVALAKIFAQITGHPPLFFLYRIPI